jgi:hypothetical protein
MRGSGDRDASWIRNLLPILILAAAFGVGYAFNFFIALAMVVIALGIWISRYLQRTEPPRLGE